MNDPHVSQSEVMLEGDQKTAAAFFLMKAQVVRLDVGR